MARNHTAVITAKRFLEAAQVAQMELREEYDKPKQFHGQAKIAGLHQAINYGLKQAEVSALIAIGEELAGLRDEFSAFVDDEPVEFTLSGEAVGRSGS